MIYEGVGTANWIGSCRCACDIPSYLHALPHHRASASRCREAEFFSLEKQERLFVTFTLLQHLKYQYRWDSFKAINYLREVECKYIYDMLSYF